MPKLILLNSDRDFDKLRFSKPFFARHLKLRKALGLNQNQPRFGFIVPKRVVPKVTDRNLIKRRLKAIVRKNLEQILPHDILFFPQRSAGLIKFAELQTEVINLFKIAKLWKL